MLRRILTVALVVATIGTTPLAAQAHHKPGWVQMCNRERPYSYNDLKAMIYCATDRWGGDAEKIISMGSCESGLEEDEYGNPPYIGVFQYHPDTWRSTADDFWQPQWGRRHVNIPSPWNGRAQVLVTVKQVVVRGYGPWSMGRCA